MLVEHYFSFFSFFVVVEISRIIIMCTNGLNLLVNDVTFDKTKHHTMTTERGKSNNYKL